MPSVAEEHPRPMGPGRKRRRDNDVNDLQIQGPLYEKLVAAAASNWNTDGAFNRPVQQHQQQQQQAGFIPLFPTHSGPPVFQHGGPSFVSEQQESYQLADAVSRRVAPISTSKRQRMFDNERDDIEAWGETETTSPQRPRYHSRSPLPQQQHRVLQDHVDAANMPKTPSSLSPCHICHRRPTKKSDLDSFADCEGCGLRTCFVCIRECQGWQQDGRSGKTANQHPLLSRSFHMDDVDDERQRTEEQKIELDAETTGKREDGWTGGGHRQMVCSRCCIEKGREGDIMCLGCLSRV